MVSNMTPDEVEALYIELERATRVANAKGRAYTKASDYRREVILKLRAAGEPKAKIARRLNVSRSRVDQIADDAVPKVKTEETL